MILPFRRKPKYDWTKYLQAEQSMRRLQRSNPMAYLYNLDKQPVPVLWLLAQEKIPRVAQVQKSKKLRVIVTQTRGRETFVIATDNRHIAAHSWARLLVKLVGGSWRSNYGTQLGKRGIISDSSRRTSP